MIFNHNNKDVDITFTAIDSEGKTYTYTKLGYPRGFKNNKYYYGDAELELLDGIITPNVSGVKEYEAVEVSDDNLYMKYNIYDNPVNLFISGKSEQNLFQLNYDGTVTLNNLNASHSSNNAFINSSHEVSLVLSGNNNITCNENDVCIWVSELILSCTGESATLTLTNNSYDWESGGIGGSISAADGFSVECSGPNPNYDEFHPTSPLSYSTKYTVTKNP